jgi:hypothetical protein
MNDMNTLKNKARTAGLLYLLLAITSIFGLVYVPSKIIVQGNDLATIHNIVNSPVVYRLGIISNLIYLVVFVFLVLAFYDLLKAVNKKQALMMVVLVVVAIPVAFLNELNHFALLLLSAEGETSQLISMAPLFIKLYQHGSFMVMLFWGLWLFPLGLLIIHSKFIPRIFGFMLIVGGGGYVVSSITFLFSEESGRAVFHLATTPSAIAEIAIIFWLLIKGAKDTQETLGRPAHIIHADISS